jgi:hypothetical protein
MAIGSITTDYTGRTVDLEALQTIDKVQSLTRLFSTISLNNTSGRITGLQKLVQRYAILFLTRTNDVRFAPGQGTNFLNALDLGQIQTNETVVHQFVFANSLVVSQLRSEDAARAFGDPAPNDERIARASLLDFEIDYPNARLFLQIQITNIDGDGTVYVLPTN